jgi:pleiotropic regulator 1
MNLV